MKIAHLTGGIGREAAGVGKAVADMSRGQLEAGHDVRVFAPYWQQWSAESQADWAGAPAETFDVVRPFPSLGRMAGLAQALDAFAPDIVHVHGLWMWHGEDAYQWHRRTGRPYVLSPHGMLSSVALGFSRWKKRLVGLLFQDRAIREAAAIHVTVPSESDEVRAYGFSGLIETIPLGIEPLAIPQCAPRGATKQIVSIGRIHEKKGLDRLIDAWAMLEAQYPDWSVVIAGPDEGGHARQLNQMITQHGLTRISIVPPVYGKDRDMMLAAAQLFALPTRSENFALTVPESLMMEVPVISTTGAPWSGLVEHDCGWWVEQGVEPFKMALEAAMQLSDDQRQAMGRRGRQWILQEFDQATLTDRTLAAYARHIDAARLDNLN